MAGFFENFAMGALSSGGDILAERRKQQMNDDELRKKALSQISVETTVYNAKKDRDKRDAEIQKENILSALGVKTANDTTQAVIDSKKNDALNMQSRASMPADLAAPESDTAPSDEELGLPPIQIADNVTPPADVKPAGTDLTNGPMTGFSPEQQASLISLAKAGADMKEIITLQNKYREENAAPGKALAAKQTQVDAYMNEKDPARKAVLGQALGIKPEELPQDEGTKIQQAIDLGVPYVKNPYEGKAKDPTKAIADGEKILAKEYDTTVAPAIAVMGDLDRLAELNKQLTTGFAAGAGSSISGFLGVGKAGEMNKIADRIAPKFRVQGGGSSSDTDVKMLKNGLPGLSSANEVNANLIAGLKAAKQNEIDYHDFKGRFLSANGFLSEGEMRRSWKEYVEANPIFDKSSKDGNLVLNEARMSSEEYFRNKATGQQATPKDNKPQALRVDPTTGEETFDFSGY